MYWKSKYYKLFSSTTLGHKTVIISLENYENYISRVLTNVNYY